MLKDEEDSLVKLEMKTLMLLVWESSSQQRISAKEIKTEELAKENGEKENATIFEVT